MKQSVLFQGLKAMESKRHVAALVMGVLLACGPSGPAMAAEPVVKVRDAWVRAPVPGQSVAGAYMELTASAKSALVAVASPVAARGELHNMTMSGGVMKMRAAERIELPAGKAVKLEPGGYHVMLIDLKRALKPGEKIPLTLTVQRPDAGRSTLTVQADVRGMDGASMHSH